jgi:hypothetical protein
MVSRAAPLLLSSSLSPCMPLDRGASQNAATNHGSPCAHGGLITSPRHAIISPCHAIISPRHESASLLSRKTSVSNLMSGDDASSDATGGSGNGHGGGGASSG